MSKFTPQSALAAAVIAITATGPSLAQNRTDKGTTASQQDIPPQTALPLPDSTASQGYLFNLRPLGENIGAALAERGIYLTGHTFNEGFGNVSGGLKRGWEYEGYTTFGTDLDMQRIAGIEGGSVHILFNDLNGIPFLGYSGSAYVNNKVFGGVASARLNEFSYEQSFFNKNLDIRIGRVPIGPEFDTSDLYCEFVYALCATPSGYAFTKGYPSYLTASWAAVAQIKLPQHFYLNVAAYEDEPLLATRNHPNLPGEDWGFDKFRGVTLPVQFGYRTSYADDPYPVSVDVGAYYDTGDYTDPLLNTMGQNRVAYGGTPELDHGKSSVWLQAQKVVWRPDMTTKRGITLFGAANFTTSGAPNLQDAVFGGVSWQGPLPSRPNDKINIAGEYLWLNSDYITAADTNIALRHIRGGLSRTESLIEVNYDLAVAPGVIFKPFVDYIGNPDQVGISAPNPSVKHALVVGAAISVFFPEAFGLPRLGTQMR